MTGKITLLRAYLVASLVSSLDAWPFLHRQASMERPTDPTPVGGEYILICCANTFED